MNDPANDHDLRLWLAERRPDLDLTHLDHAQLCSTALAHIAAHTADPAARQQAHIALAAEFPTIPDPAQPPAPLPFLRLTLPLRITPGQTYRLADPKHYLHLAPGLDTSGQTTYLTNDRPPGHPRSLARVDEQQQ